MPTQPGTEIKVTPDNEVPIIPKATKYRGEFLFPTKNELLSAPLDVMRAISNRNRKYNATIPAITAELIPYCKLKRSFAMATMSSPIAKHAVAAGEGAFST